MGKGDEREGVSGLVCSGLSIEDWADRAVFLV
jgi:hypothetical protein